MTGFYGTLDKTLLKSPAETGLLGDAKKEAHQKRADVAILSPYYQNLKRILFDNGATALGCRDNTKTDPCCAIVYANRDEWFDAVMEPILMEWVLSGIPMIGQYRQNVVDASKQWLTCLTDEEKTLRQKVEDEMPGVARSTTRAQGSVTPTPKKLKQKPPSPLT